MWTHINEKNQLEIIPVCKEAGLEGYWLNAYWFEGYFTDGLQSTNFGENLKHADKKRENE